MPSSIDSYTEQLCAYGYQSYTCTCEQTLDVFQMICRTCNYPFVRLDGTTAVKKRQKIVDEFNDPSSHQVCHVSLILRALCDCEGMHVVIVCGCGWNMRMCVDSLLFCWVARQVDVVLIWLARQDLFSSTQTGILPATNRPVLASLSCCHSCQYVSCELCCLCVWQNR